MAALRSNRKRVELIKVGGRNGSVGVFFVLQFVLKV